MFLSVEINSEVRKSSSELLFKKGFVKNFEKFARKYFGWSPFFLDKTERVKRKL